MEKVALADAADQLTDFWSQNVVGTANGNLFKVAKGIGSTTRRTHQDQEETFLVPPRSAEDPASVRRRRTGRWRPVHHSAGSRALPARSRGGALPAHRTGGHIHHGRRQAYAPAKSAHWSLTKGVRLELAYQGTLVTGLALGPIATEAFADYDVPGVNDPAAVVARALDGIHDGRIEVIADDATRRVKAALAGDPQPYVLPRVEDLVS